MKAKKGPVVAKKSKDVSFKKKKKLQKVSKHIILENKEESSDDDLIIRKSKGSVTEEEMADSEDSDTFLDASEHKKSLTKLKKQDPEFYKFLEQNDDELLNFNLSGEEQESSDEDNSKHIPDNNLEVASDESDFDPKDGEDTVGQSGFKVTLKLLQKWQEDILTDKSATTIRHVVQAFHAALGTVEGSTNNKNIQYKVAGGTVFNGVIQLCVFHLPEAFGRFLKLTSDTDVDAHKSKRFPKVKGMLKSYLKDLIKILDNISSMNILTVLLKHLHQMLRFTLTFSTLRKPLLKMLLKFWSSGEETVRVVAFVCILRIARCNKEANLEVLLKTMYIKYVENAKFVSPNTMPGINFMRHSLVEIYLLDGNFAYKHAFLYIRQLAIQLRNAITLKKKENFQAVYNWQFVNSLRFWSELLSLSKEQSMLRQLIYPLVQIINGTIKVIPTAQYYPLRFHCVKMLIDISRDTGIFIPSLPYTLEVLNSYDFNKKHKNVTMKPMSMICLLRMSKSQMQENGFKDSIIENLYHLILENAAKDSHTIYFPDLYIPCIIQMKEFLKKCHIGTFGKKMKQLLDKIEENRKFIENERAKVTFDLKNMKDTQSWEKRIKAQETPLAKFFEAWYKIYESQKLKLLTQNDDMGNYHLPTIKRSKGLKRRDENSDNSDLDMPVEEVEKMAKKKVKSKKKKTVKDKKAKDVELPTNDTDIVRDTEAADWD